MKYEARISGAEITENGTWNSSRNWGVSDVANASTNGTSALIVSHKAGERLTIGANRRGEKVAWLLQLRVQAMGKEALAHGDKGPRSRNTCSHGPRQRSTLRRPTARGSMAITGRGSCGGLARASPGYGIGNRAHID